MNWFRKLIAKKQPAYYWEWGLIIAWAVWIGRGYLNNNPRMWPWGAEFPMVILPSYIWTLLAQCGDCVFWNGFLNGGYPAFAELHGAPLHPLTIITTLLQGPINGAKTNLILHLALAGFAQWWLARSLNLGLIPRMWGALMAVAGGHLAGRMELGLFPLVMSTASASLVLAAGLDLAVKKNTRAATGLGICLSLLILSGQGYLQIGVLVSLLPAFLIFLLNSDLRLNSLTVKFAQAGILALLLSAIFLVPLLHFLPQFVKDTDAYFSTAQPLKYLPLNLIIDDDTYHQQETMGKLGLPFLYTNYIGWLPVLLALGRLFQPPSAEKRRLYFFFLVSLILVFLAASTISLKVVFSLAPEFLIGIRNPPLIAGLSVPLVLGLASWALDDLLKQNFLHLSLESQSNFSIRINLIWILMVIPLVWSLKSVNDFSRKWLVTTPAGEDLRTVLQTMKTTSTQWIQLPFGEHFWQPDAANLQLKLTNVYRPWHWKERELPPARLEGVRFDDAVVSSGYLRTVEGIHILSNPQNQYAFVESGQSRQDCLAEAFGGFIKVICRNAPAGRLVVMENYFSGWTAQCDGRRVALDPQSPWLSVWLPAGDHECRFNYRPWDVYVGFLFTLIGLIAVGYLWHKTDPDTTCES